MKDEIRKDSDIGQVIKKWWNNSRLENQHSLNHHLDAMEKAGKWATDLEIVSFQIIYKIRLFSLKNTAEGFSDSLPLEISFDMLQISNDTTRYILDEGGSVANIHIYHHFCGQPWRVENACGNHYMYLKPMRDNTTQISSNPYKGGPHYDFTAYAVDNSNTTSTSSSQPSATKTTSTSQKCYQRTP